HFLLPPPSTTASQTTTHPPPPPQLCSSPRQPFSPDTSTYPPTWIDDDRGSLHSAYSVAQRIKRRAMREQREREEEKEMGRKKRAGSSDVRGISVETGVEDLVDEMICVEAEAEAEGNDIQHPELIQENHPTCQERPVPSPNRQNDPSPTTQRPPGISTSFLSSPRPSTWHPGDMTGPLTTTTGRFPIRQHVARPSSSSSAESPSQFAVRTDLGLKPQKKDQQVQNLDGEDEGLLSLCSSSSSSIFSLAPSPPPLSSLHDQQQQQQQQQRGPSIPTNLARSQPPSHTFRAPMPPRAPSPSVNSRASTPVNWAVGDVRERLRRLEEGHEKELRGDMGEEVQRRRVRFVGENEIEGGDGEVPVAGVVDSRLEESGEGAEDGYARNEEFGDGMSEKVIMAINYTHRRLGCAYYNSTTERLCLMEDMEEAPPFDLVKMLKFQICPTTILTSARADEAFLTLLKANEMGLTHPPPVDLHSSTAFAHTSGRTRLLSTRIRTMTRGSRWNDANKKDVYLYLAGFVDMESQVTVGCVGALIGYLNRIRAEGLLPETSEDEDRPLEVLGVEPFSLSTIMHTNADTLSSLQIFEDESHPNMHQSRGKEGLSLFGILNNTRTTLGASLLKQWFLRPVLDFVLLDHRHRTIECLLLPENLHVAEQVGSCLRNVKNVPRILDSMRGRVGVTEWQKILQFAYYCLRIRNLVRELTNCDVPVMNRIKETFVVNDLKDVGSFINDVIDFDESVTENRFVVKQHVDEELDELKRVYAGLDEFLFQIAQEISTTIPSNFASTLNVIYFPQLGYLITVPLRSEWKKEEDFQIEGLYYQFSTATTVYYKNDRMRQLDETLGDIHGLIVDKEIEIMQMLSERVLEYAPLLICTAEVCAELDCLLSLADAARKYNYCRPTMANENVLKIVRGRHPLQELCVDVFIPNDTYLIGGRGVTRHQGLAENDDDREPGESDSRLTSSSSERNSNHAECGDQARESGGVNSVILLSGANYSGKSVYLKQVALITYMAHIGRYDVSIMHENGYHLWFRYNTRLYKLPQSHEQLRPGRIRDHWFDRQNLHPSADARNDIKD
ncbi:hypothetical protein BC936DRAFT_148657, partial [Jimgerdemannia flammicorona]